MRTYRPFAYAATSMSSDVKKNDSASAELHAKRAPSDPPTQIHEREQICLRLIGLPPMLISIVRVKSGTWPDKLPPLATEVAIHRAVRLPLMKAEAVPCGFMVGNHAEARVLARVQAAR